MMQTRLQKLKEQPRVLRSTRTVVPSKRLSLSLQELSPPDIRRRRSSVSPQQRTPTTPLETRKTERMLTLTDPIPSPLAASISNDAHSKRLHTPITLRQTARQKQSLAGQRTQELSESDTNSSLSRETAMDVGAAKIEHVNSWEGKSKDNIVERLNDDTPTTERRQSQRITRGRVRPLLQTRSRSNGKDYSALAKAPAVIRNRPWPQEQPASLNSHNIADGKDLFWGNELRHVHDSAEPDGKGSSNTAGLVHESKKGAFECIVGINGVLLDPTSRQLDEVDGFKVVSSKPVVHPLFARKAFQFEENSMDVDSDPGSTTKTNIESHRSRKTSQHSRPPSNQGYPLYDGPDQDDSSRIDEYNELHKAKVDFILTSNIQRVPTHSSRDQSSEGSQDIHPSHQAIEHLQDGNDNRDMDSANAVGVDTSDLDRCPEIQVDYYYLRQSFIQGKLERLKSLDYDLPSYFEDDCTSKEGIDQIRAYGEARNLGAVDRSLKMWKRSCRHVGIAYFISHHRKHYETSIEYRPSYSTLPFHAGNHPLVYKTAPASIKKLATSYVGHHEGHNHSLFQLPLSSEAAPFQMPSNR